MKRKKGWVILGSILIAILAILTVIGFLFRDDGSLSGFVTEDGQKEYAVAYDEAMNHLPEPVESYQTGMDSLKDPNSEMVVFEDASHAINGEYPKELLETIEAFLAKIE